MDIVICIALKDILFLNKNIFFIQKNINPGHIYIITDKRNNRYITKDYDNVTIIDENNLIPGLNFSAVKTHIDKNGFKYRQYGWYYQQFLKLGFALSQYAKKEYLVWDADTVPFNPIEFKNGEKYLLLPKTEHNQAYFDTIDKLFDAPLKANYSFISEHMVFDVDIVKEMLGCIVNKGKANQQWFEVCINSINPTSANGFSEFETYGTYCLNYHPDLFEMRTLRTFRRCGYIYGIFVTKTEINSLRDDLDTGSFEAYDYPIALCRRIKQKIFFNLCKLITKLRVFVNIPI